MKKYKLIKEYPGSPDLGAEVEFINGHSSNPYYLLEDKRYFVLRSHVENQPEYWEEVNDIYYMVSLTDMPFNNAWEPIRVEAIPFDTHNRKYFNNKEGAEYFIITNKPCLSLSDIKTVLSNCNKKRDLFLELKQIVKKRI